MTMLKRIPPKFYRCAHCHTKLVLRIVVYKTKSGKQEKAAIRVCPRCGYIRNEVYGLPNVSDEAERRVQERISIS